MKEMGGKVILRLLALALLLGLAVTLLHPSYRQALAALLQGEPETSPIWQSNAGYYPMIGRDGERVSDEP